jgi:hypothetical protein
VEEAGGSGRADDSLNCCQEHADVRGPLDDTNGYGHVGRLLARESKHSYNQSDTCRPPPYFKLKYAACNQ